MKYSVFLPLFLLPSLLSAQSYDSGSDGSDGALVIAPDLGEVYFNPDDFDPALDPDRDGVYHFTTITIGEGTFVFLTAGVLGHRPVIWLAQGDVTIEGEIYLNTINDTDAGAGGFPGGSLQHPGMGPGASGEFDIPAVHAVSGENVEAYGNAFLVPALGGSGAVDYYERVCHGGGSIILASSRSITIGSFGHISTSSWHASSGSIRLIAPVIHNMGDVNLPKIEIGDSQNIGRARIESFITMGSPLVSTSTKAYGTVVETTPGPAIIEPPIKIVSVQPTGGDALAVPQKPGASGSDPDLTIDAVDVCTVTVQAKGIPLGTPVIITIWNEALGKFEYTTGGLEGTLEQSTASAVMEIPPGKNIFLASADWRNQP